MLKEDRNYIAIITKDKSSDYTVTFPDFEGCISAGKTLDEAQLMANEALQLQIDGMLEDNCRIPYPTSLDEIKKNNKKSEIFLVVPVKVPTKVTRINITVDEIFLRKLDRFLQSHNESRSGFFVNAAKKYMKQ